MGFLYQVGLWEIVGRSSLLWTVSFPGFGSGLCRGRKLRNEHACVVPFALAVDIVEPAVSSCCCLDFPDMMDHVLELS